MFKTIKDIVLLVGGVFVIIGSLYKAYVEIHKKLIKLSKKKDVFFSGNWTNEGDFEVKNPSHYIDLTLNCLGKKISGSFNVRKIDADQKWHAVTILGKRHFSTLKCEIIHTRDGKVLNYGKVVFKKSSEKNLKWQLEAGISDFFPLETTLFRSLPSII